MPQDIQVRLQIFQTALHLLVNVEVGLNEFAVMRPTAVGHEPQVGVVRLGGLVVHRVKEVDPVLVGFVREVSKQALVDEVLHLPARHLQKFI